MPTPGQKGWGGAGQLCCSRGGPHCSQTACFVLHSLYCPKDNIEEALLLLLISESMVSAKVLPGPPASARGEAAGLRLDHQVLAKVNPCGCHCSRLCLPPSRMRLVYEL